MDIEQEIKHLNKLITEYEESGDAKQLTALLAKDFAILRSSGESQGCQKFLSAVESNKNRGRRIEQPQVQAAANTALYTCIVTTAQNPDGTPNAGRFLNVRVFTREGGDWRCAVWQVFKLPLS